jgi:ABC-type antimicrobial peptide transport system permease subunit
VALLRDGLSPLPSHVDARPEDLVNLSRDDGMLIALGLLLGALALAMLAHTVVTAARQGRHNHATLRALGYVRRQSGLTVLWQSLTLAMGALALGLPLGLLAGRRIWSAYATGLGVAKDAFVPLPPILLALVGAVAVAFLAAVPSSLYVIRTNLARTLRSGD